MTAVAAIGAFDLILKYAPLAVSSVAQAEQLIERLLDRKRTLEQASTDRAMADARLDADLAAAGLASELAALVPPAVAPGSMPTANPAPADTGETAADALSATVRELSDALQRVKDDNQRLADQLAAEQAKTPAVTGESEDVANGGPNAEPFDPDLFADGSSRDSIKHLGEHLPPPPGPAGP
jgi:hypothetical protein